MNPDRRKGRRVPPVVVSLFRPARWCRRQRPRFWFKLLAGGLVCAGVIWLLGTWSALANQGTWDNWLANMRFSGSRSGNANARRIRIPDLVDTEPLPNYLGDGNAELGEYSIRVFDPITQSLLRTDFQLAGTTSLGDEDSFQHFMRHNRRFFREQVAIVLRMHNFDDLSSPDLDLLGRKIVARVNRSLGERMLKSAEIKNFSLHESIDRSGFVLFEPGEEDGVP